MPDSRKHRGAHPQDVELFQAAQWPKLRAAVHDLSWLLTRDYPPRGAVQLVGNRYELLERQRLAVLRSSCSDAALASRRARCVADADLAGQPIWLDAFNVIITIEAALSGGVVLAGRDGCLRDMASMHGSYRKVAETEPALRHLGRLLHEELQVGPCRWLLDRPVSNSGRLRALMLQVAEQHGWPWQVELEDNPDAMLRECPAVVATADANILDHCSRWHNLAARAVWPCLPDVWLVRCGESY